MQIFRETNVAALLVCSKFRREAFFSLPPTDDIPRMMDALLSVRPHASPVSRWVHSTDNPDSYSAMLHNTSRRGPLYESKASYLSCGLQLEQKELLTKLLWEPLDRFKRMNSTLDTIAHRSHGNHLSPTHRGGALLVHGDHLCLFFLGVTSWRRVLSLAEDGLTLSEIKSRGFLFRGKSNYHSHQESRYAKISPGAKWLLWDSPGSLSENRSLHC